jgi:hypothetical protein
MHNIDLPTLIDTLIEEKYTLVDQHERFNMLIRHYDSINKLDGDVIECGVWRGGMSIFLTKLFHEKQIWLADSFSGFQDHNTAKYPYGKETHFLGGLAVSLDEVLEHLAKFDLKDEPRIHFLPGYVVHTLHPDVCPVESISLLRVDVDAYSATLAAIRTFRERENIPLQLYNVTTDQLIPNEVTQSLPCGCYAIKPS